MHNRRSERFMTLLLSVAWEKYIPVTFVIYPHGSSVILFGFVYPCPLSSAFSMCELYISVMVK